MWSRDDTATTYRQPVIAKDVPRTSTNVRVTVEFAQVYLLKLSSEGF